MSAHQRFKVFAKYLIGNQTPEEIEFGRILTELGIVFEPQRVFRIRHYGCMIVDFFIPSANVVFEIDGRQHLGYRGITRDMRKADGLARRGIKTFHILNPDVYGPDIRQRIQEIIGGCNESRVSV